MCSLASSPREAIAKLDHPGHPVLACSASGRCISAVWPQLRAYAVYSLAPTGTWEVVDRGARTAYVWGNAWGRVAVWVAIGRQLVAGGQWQGGAWVACKGRHTLQGTGAAGRHVSSCVLPPHMLRRPTPPAPAMHPCPFAWHAGSGNSVVWSSTAPMYAVLSVPNIPTAAPKKKKSFFGVGGAKRAAQAAEEAELAAEAARAAARSTTVEVHVVNEEAGSQVG